MLSFSKVKENIITSFLRSLKVFEFGAKTADVIAPFGDDSAPNKDMIALYGKTTNGEDNVVIGYVNRNQIALPGEKRIFSEKTDGTVSTYIHLFTDNTMAIGGDTDNAVRYTPLNIGITAKDALINTELAKIAVSISALGGSYTPGNVITDITTAKIENIKV